MPAASCDVLVLGAGIAGCAAAITARGHGMSVTVLDRFAAVPRQPGETLHPGAGPLLAQLGVEDQVAGQCEVRHAGVWIGDGQSRRFEPYGRDDAGPWLGYQIDRRLLGSVLRARALACGARLIAPAVVEHALVEEGRVLGLATTECNHRAHVTIDASGRHSWLAGALGIGWGLYSSPMYATWEWVPRDSEQDECPEFIIDANGWRWSAPLSRTIEARVRLDRGRAPLQGSAVGRDMTWRRRERVAGAGYFLTGDAAAVLDPSSSHGVLRALMGGIFAATLAKTCTEPAGEAEAARLYSGWLVGQFGHDVAALAGLGMAGAVVQATDTR